MHSVEVLLRYHPHTAMNVSSNPAATDLRRAAALFHGLADRNRLAIRAHLADRERRVVDVYPISIAVPLVSDGDASAREVADVTKSGSLHLVVLSDGDRSQRRSAPGVGRRFTVVASSSRRPGAIDSTDTQRPPKVRSKVRHTSLGAKYTTFHGHLRVLGLDQCRGARGLSRPRECANAREGTPQPGARK